jgi:hypothetical protein
MFFCNRRPRHRYSAFVMNEFPSLLVRASRELGTMLAVASLLGEEPRQVYRWIAGLDLPDHQRVDQLTERLLTVL